MNSASAVSDFYTDTVIDITSKSKITKHYEDLMAKLLFQRAKEDLSALSRANLNHVATMLASSPALQAVGTANVGRAFGNTYQTLISRQAGLTVGGVTHYGHSPEALAAAGAVTSYLSDTTHGNYAGSVRGNLEQNSYLLQQHLRRNGLGTNDVVTYQRDKKAETGSFIDYYHKLSTKAGRESLGIDSGISASEVKKTETQRELLSYIRNREEFKGKSSAEIARMYKDNKNGILIDFMREQFDGKEMDYETYKSVSQVLVRDLENINVTENALEQNRVAGDKQPGYTAMSAKAKKEADEMLKRSNEMLKGLAELVGTEDIKQLESVAQQFGAKTLTTENDVKNLKHLIDSAKTRALVTGRSMQDVLGEMQGIAAVSAQALGPGGVSAAFVTKVADNVEALSDTEAAGGISKEKTVARNVASEQNRQNYLAEAAYLLDHEGLKNDNSEEMQRLRALQQKADKGTLTEAEFEEIRVLGGKVMRKNFGINYDADRIKNEAIQTETYTKLAAGADKSTAGWHSEKLVNEFMETEGVKALSSDQQDLVRRGAQARMDFYSGDTARVKTHINAIKGFESQKEFDDYKTAQLNQLKEQGATDKDIADVTAFLDSVNAIKAAPNGAIILDAMQNMAEGSSFSAANVGKQAELEKKAKDADVFAKSLEGSVSATTRQAAAASVNAGTIYDRVAYGNVDVDNTTTNEVLYRGLTNNNAITYFDENKKYHRRTLVGTDDKFDLEAFNRLVGTSQDTEDEKNADKANADNLKFNHLVRDGHVVAIKADEKGRADASALRKQITDLQTRRNKETDAAKRKDLDTAINTYKSAFGKKDLSDAEFTEYINNATNTTLTSDMKSAKESGGMEFATDRAGNIVTYDVQMLATHTEQFKKDRRMSTLIGSGLLEKVAPHLQQLIEEGAGAGASKKSKRLRQTALKKAEKYSKDVANIMQILDIQTVAQKDGKMVWESGDGTAYSLEDTDDIMKAVQEKSPEFYNSLETKAKKGDLFARTLLANSKNKLVGSTTAIRRKDGSYVMRLNDEKNRVAKDHLQNEYLRSLGTDENTVNKFSRARIGYRTSMAKFNAAKTEEEKAKHWKAAQGHWETMMSVDGAADMLTDKGNNTNYAQWLRSDAARKAGVYKTKEGLHANAVDSIYNEALSAGVISGEEDKDARAHNMEKNIQDICNALVTEKDTGDDTEAENTVKGYLHTIAKEV